jgi:3-hydroxybutyryl-CoA dehydratase
MTDHPEIHPHALGVGTEAHLDVDVSPDLVRSFIEVSGDDAPLHTDPTFAREHGFAGPLVHGALLAALVSRLVGTRLPGPQAVLERMDLAFRKPCYAPCRLRVSGRVRQVSEAVASVMLEVSVSLVDGDVLATGKTWHKLLPPTPETT